MDVQDEIPDERYLPSAWSKTKRFAAGSVFALMALIGLDPPSSDADTFAPFLVAYFGIGAAVFLSRALSSKPDLELVEQGLRYRGPFGGGYIFVPWSELIEVDVSKWAFWAPRVVQLIVADYDVVQRGSSLGRRWELLINRHFNRRRIPIQIPVDVNRAELAERIEALAIASDRRAMLASSSHELNLDAPSN